MPYTRLPVPERVPNQEFVDGLALELLQPHDEHAPTLPDIIEEPVAGSDRIYVTVIWDTWHDVPPQERGQIILDAYIHAFGPDSVRLISVAMGLTHTEARRLGLPRSLAQPAA